MKKNKKLLVSFLALNVTLTSYAESETLQPIKYERMYNSIVKNIEKGNSNEKTYQIIEKILKQKNKELKDLYLQGDYIVKPEYLEWQVFFTGFYEEYNEGVDNTKENAMYHSKVTGYYDANGNYVVTSGSINGMMGKAYRPLQEYKEIDLGIALEVREPGRQPVSLGITKPPLPLVTPLTPKSPTVGTVSPTLPPLVSFTVPSITAPATPALVTIPTPTFNTVVVSNFNPVNPVVTMPATFTPPALDKISTGFGQGAAIGVNVENNILGNASASPVGGGTTVIKVRDANFDISGAGFNWNGYNDSTTASGTQGIGTVGSNYKHTFLNALAGSYTISGNWDFRNETTVSSPNTTRFVSVNHAYGAKTLNTVFEIAAGSNINLYGRTDGHMTVGIEYQSYDALPAKAINKGIITLQSGKNLFGMTAMIESYAYTSTVRQPLEGSTLENRNRIVINSEDSIGIDFAQYTYVATGRPLTLYVATGNIDINGQHNYGLRVPTVFDTQANGTNYFNETLIDGSGGVITVAGTENVGVSLSKKITGSSLVAGVQGLAASNSSDIIGNIRNLNILVNGTKGVGILRNENFVTTTPGEIELNNTHIQSLAFGDNAQNSVLIRNDKYGVALNKNITINNTNAVNTATDNIVMLANDKNNLGGKLTYVNNKAVITIGNNLKRATGLLAMNGGHALNSGTIAINGANSQGISVFGLAAGIAATGENSGTINVSGKESLGVYNAGTFGMSSGSIVSRAENSIGIYSDNTVNTTINGGNITAKDGGIALYSGDNSTIKLSGTGVLKAEAGGLLFYNYVNPSKVVTGKYDITGVATAQVDRGGMVLYADVTGISDIPAVAAAIKGAFNNSSNLTVNMANGSNIMFIKSPGGTANITDFTGLPNLKTGFFNFTGTGYYEYVMSDFELTLNNTQESILDSGSTGGSYGKIQFLDTNVTVNSGITVAGTQTGQVAAAQKNKIGGILAVRHITNNGIISLSGNQSTGIAGDYITIKNTATGEINIGIDSVGIYTANGSEAVNEGKITLREGSVGIYGRNYFDGTTNSGLLGYGTDKINIKNEKNIETISGVVTGSVTGIYANNILSLSDSSVNLTSSSNINLKGIGNVVGVFVGKTNLTSSGAITAESAAGGNSVGIYGENSTAASITGSINIKGGNGTGIYLKNSNMSNDSTITVDNVDSGIGMYIQATSGNTSLGANNQLINIGSNVTGIYAVGASAADTGTVTNTGTIQSLSTSANKAIGMYIGSNGIGNNSGNIYLTAVGTDKDQVGVYNDSGTFNMTGGNIEVYSSNGAGLYAKSGTANALSGGIIKTGNGAIGLYADNGSTIQLSGTYKSVVDNGGIFALNNGTGTINIAGGNNITVDIEAGGMAFSSVGALNTYLGSLVTGGGTLEINLKDPTSKLAILDSPETILLSSIGTSYAPGATITPQVKISLSSNPNYTPFSITKGQLIVDQTVNLDSATDSYNKSDFINSSVDINSSISGTGSGQLAAGQINYGAGSTATDRARITINNNNTINLSGNNSTGLLADFGDISNAGGSFIKVTGEQSTGIYAANGTAVNNTGTINIGNKSIGIYGVNYLDGVTSSSTLGYGNDRIDITNNGNIISTGTTHGGYGIYANNTAVPAANSIINLGSGSNIDISSGEAGIGVYAVNSTLNIDGNITVGKDGVGVYASGTTGTINSGTVSLNGDNAIGYYLTNSSAFTNLGGTIAVNGKNITLMITDASSSINLSTPFTVTSTPGSTYVVGNMIGGEFYNNTSATLGSNGSLINGIGTVSLFGIGSNINSTGSNVSGMVLSGQYSTLPYTFTGPLITVTEEGTNLGTISLGDSSAGMYLTGGARGKNEGTITVNNNSVGIYAESSGVLLSHIVNDNGIINIGQESTGLFLKDGSSISNTGSSEINSTSLKAVGIYSENNISGTTTVVNSNKIALSGDQSIGIYTTGSNNITNSGIIGIGNSSSQTQPGVGIYADHAGSSITNTAAGIIYAGDNSIGIYNQNGSVVNSGAITVGNGGTAIYSGGGTIALNVGSLITVGQNDGVGVYALNQSGTVINNSTVSVGDGSYGFVFTGSTVPSFINNQLAVIGNKSIFVFADSVLTADNSGTLTMTGSDNIGYYLKSGGSFISNANIIGNTGVSNIGVYAKGANLVNDADIILGDSNLVEHTDSNGEKYKTGYSVGIYGEDSNITNNAGNTIQVGKDGIGIYVKGAGYTAENRGIINGFGDGAKGIFASDNAIVNNYGIINMVGDDVIGIAGQSGAQIYNHTGSVINVTGNDVAGIYLAGDDTKLVNDGTINIIGIGMGILYTSTVDKSNNVADSTGTTQGYTSKQYVADKMPTLTNTGVININVGGNFNYDGIRVIVTIDPTKNTPTTNSSSQVGFGGVIPNKLEVAPAFSIGTASDRYVFENIFRGTTGKGEYISQSLTWVATADGSSLVMTRKAYTDFTDGLWYEDFGRELNEKYALTNGEGRKIFDKINYITNEIDFRHIMASLAGNVYANINQREDDIAKTFENSLHLLQDSTNNTKENVKISIIAGKGKNKEETDGVVSYDYTTTGVLALREVEKTYKHTFGYSLGYVHTGFEFKDGNKSEEWVDTIQLGIHNKYKSNGWELRNDLTGRASIHNVDRNIDWPSPNSRSEMDGTYETYSITSDNILGKEFKLGKKSSVMPYGAFKTMYVTRPSFEEKGLESLEVEGNDAWSAKSRAGIELKGAVPLGTNWQLKGTLDLAYEYELSDLNEREKARLTVIEDGYHKLSKPEDEKGIFRTKAFVGVEVEDRYGIFLTGEYSTGNDKDDEYRAGITLKVVF